MDYRKGHDFLKRDIAVEYFHFFFCAFKVYDVRILLQNHHEKVINTEVLTL